MGALARHFADKNATWVYTELQRVVKGCNTAYVLYDATYAIPSAGYSARSLVGVSYTRKQGRWRAVADQSTPLKAQ